VHVLVTTHDPIHYLSLFFFLILDATHIFDGLNDFPTHVAHMRFGSFVQPPSPWPPTAHGPGANTLLYDVALQWLADDREYRRGLERQGRKLRGARRDQPTPADSETFYKK
jgi:CCR4-NOT complex subunit CAF16